MDVNKKTIITILLALVAVTGQAQTILQAWFKTDTIIVKGQIEGYNAEQFGFTTMLCYLDDVMEKDNKTLVMEINPDGTFEKNFPISYPMHLTFVASGESKVGFSGIPFFARPGETVDVTVRIHEGGRYDYVFNGGSSRDVERWLRSCDEYSDLFMAIPSFKGKLEDGNKLTESIWQNAMNSLQTVSQRDHYTPMEMQLALADIQAYFAKSYLSYVDNHVTDLVKYEERDGEWHAEVLDSVEYKKIFEAKNYYPLRHIDFDNPLLLASQAFDTMLNRIQFADYARKSRYNGIDDENDGMEVVYQNYSTALSNYLAALRDLMGTDKDNLVVQLCAYKDMQSDFDCKMFPLYLAAFTHPYIHQKVEQFYNNQMAQTDIASPLPVTPMADLIRSLCAKYPGKILMIDFWGMSCGPCRGAIQLSKELRAEIAKRDDVKLIFIAGEQTTEGSDEYKKYVSEWLADEETICVTKSDFVRLQELFQFNSIPHYETITPDCRRVCDDLRINGYDNFDEELQRLKEKLK